MRHEELLAAIRSKIANPNTRIDLMHGGVPPIYQVASTKTLDETENDLGLPLPVSLRSLYMEVANGGFGPGAGLLGVPGGHTDAGGRNLGSLYLALRSKGWPRSILPLSDLGDAAWSCIQSHDATESILTMDSGQLTRTKFNLTTWLEAWVTGTDMNAETFEEAVGSMINPFTKNRTSLKRRGKAKGIPFDLPKASHQTPIR